MTPPPGCVTNPALTQILLRTRPPRCVTVRGNIWNSNKNIQIYIHLYAFKYAWMPFLSLVCPISVPQALFCSGKKCSWIFDYVNSGNSPFFFRILVYMTFWTCRKRRAPKNHAFRRYSDLQISHGELIGEQNDELNFWCLDTDSHSHTNLLSAPPPVSSTRGAK